MLQITKNASQSLLQSWVAVQHVVRLYNLSQYNVSWVNPAHVESAQICMQVMRHYIIPIPWECKFQAWINFSQLTLIWKYGFKVTSVEYMEL